MRHSQLWEQVRESPRWGFFAGKIYCALGVVLLLAKTVAGHPPPVWFVVAVMVLYLGGGAAAGAIVGLLFPLTRFFLGRVLVGVIVALPLSIGAALIVVPREDWVLLPVVAGSGALFFGLVGAIAFSIPLKR